MLGNTIAAAAASTSKSSGSLNILLIVVVLFGVLYFVMIRPQRNRQRKVAEQQNAVAPGTRVRTTAGMYATVVDVDGDDVILEVAPGVEVRYVKRAIMQVIPDGDEAAAEPGYAADDESEADEPADHDAADVPGDEHVAQSAGEHVAQAATADEPRRPPVTRARRGPLMRARTAAPRPRRTRAEPRTVCSRGAAAASGR